MREKTIEQKLAFSVKKCGGICPKFVSPGFDGMPDRLILMPGGKLAFAEVKAPGKKPRKLQKARHKLLKSLGFSVYVLDDEEQIGGMLDEIQIVYIGTRIRRISQRTQHIDLSCGTGILHTGFRCSGRIKTGSKG